MGGMWQRATVQVASCPVGHNQPTCVAAYATFSLVAATCSIINCRAKYTCRFCSSVSSIFAYVGCEYPGELTYCQAIRSWRES